MWREAREREGRAQEGSSLFVILSYYLVDYKL